jgi:hypothetical protein
LRILKKVSINSMWKGRVIRVILMFNE